MLQLREFVDKKHYAFCKAEYEAAMHFKKTCGKPRDWYDRFLISFNKETASLFSAYVK